MIIQAVKIQKLGFDTYFKGWNCISEMYGAFQNGIIAIGKTRIEAIINCMEALNKAQKDNETHTS